MIKNFLASDPIECKIKINLFIAIVNIGALKQRWFSSIITKFNEKHKHIHEMLRILKFWLGGQHNVETEN